MSAKAKKKVSLRQYTRLHASDDEVDKLLDALPYLSPVASAVLSAAVCEQQLEKILRDRIPRKDDQTWNEITDDNGPLRSFHTKILLAHALGILDHSARDNFHVVRRIRNAFAHSRKPLDFTNELITAELEKVRPPNRGGRQVYYEISGDAEEPKIRYLTLCLALNNLLMSRQADTLNKRIKRLKAKLSQPVNLLRASRRRPRGGPKAN